MACPEVLYHCPWNCNRCVCTAALQRVVRAYVCAPGVFEPADHLLYYAHWSYACFFSNSRYTPSFYRHSIRTLTNRTEYARSHEITKIWISAWNGVLTNPRPLSMHTCVHASNKNYDAIVLYPVSRPPTRRWFTEFRIYSVIATAVTFFLAKQLNKYEARAAAIAARAQHSKSNE